MTMLGVKSLAYDIAKEENSFRQRNFDKLFGKLNNRSGSRLPSFYFENCPSRLLSPNADIYDGVLMELIVLHVFCKLTRRFDVFDEAIAVSDRSVAADFSTVCDRYRDRILDLTDIVEKLFLPKKAKDFPWEYQVDLRTGIIDFVVGDDTIIDVKHENRGYPVGARNQVLIYACLLWRERRQFIKYVEVWNFKPCGSYGEDGRRFLHDISAIDGAQRDKIMQLYADGKL